MRIGKLYDALKHLVIGLLCLVFAGFLFTSLQEINDKNQVENSLETLPNYNYVPDITALKAEGKLSEGLEMARFVIRHPDMPGQEDAKVLEEELETELNSLWGRSKRVMSGFVKGSGNSIEELSGGIASDMIIWGDIRDLFKQGYYKVTGKEVDPIIASLAAIGLLTEIVDAVDWAPAVLKAFRKVGSLSQKFADFVITAAKKSAKELKLDDALKSALTNLSHLSDKMGLARASAVFKHVDEPADLASITAVAQKNVDAAYFTVKNGGADGIGIIKELGDTDVGVAAMAQAAKKGPAGVQWLKRGGSGRKYLVRTRFGARLFKNLRLHRLQQFVTEIAKNSPGVTKALWAALILSVLSGFFAFVESGRKLVGFKKNGEVIS